MQIKASEQTGKRLYSAFGCLVRADRPIPFEPAIDPSTQPCLELVEKSDLRSVVDRSTFSRLHYSEEAAGGPRFEIYQGEEEFILEHRDFIFRFVPARSRIEYAVAYPGDEHFKFGLMVEKVALPHYLLLTRENIVGLHGGAVTLDDRAWTFIGPSGVGKSTTARTLLGHGAMLLADDLTLIEVAHARALPACPAVRLWEGEGAVEQATHDTQLTEESTKRWYRLEGRYAQSEPASLGGIIVLDPLPPDAAHRGFTFERLRGQSAFTAVMGQVFNFTDPEPDFAIRRFRNVKNLLAEHRVLRYRYRRSKSGEPTHVEPLLEALQDLAADTPDAPDRP